MDALQIIHDLLAHMEWADAAVWTAVHRLGSDDEKLTGRLRHLHATQHAFLMVWRGDPLDFDHVPSDVEQWARAYYAALPKFLATVDTAALERIVRFPWAERYSKQPVAHPTTLGGTLLQIASHSTYHRGQINTRIRELGGEPPLVDYIAWLWLGKPRAEWLHPVA